MAENIEEEHLDIPSGTQSENSSGEITPAKDTETITQIQETENMEVHHHPHVGKKSFKEYLLEGLMIFLAVTMGFIAENIREHFTDRETEKRNIELIVANLKSDFSALDESIKFNTKKALLVDSILHFRNSNLTDSNTVKKFFPLFANIMTTAWFKSNNSGFEQMKSSGTIKLITKSNVLDSIYKYDEQNNSIEYNGDIDGGLIRDKIEVIAGSFLVYGEGKTGKVISAEVKPGVLNRLFNYYYYLHKNLTSFYIPELQNQKQKAINLIQLLEKEYNLKEN